MESSLPLEGATAAGRGIRAGLDHQSVGNRARLLRDAATFKRTHDWLQSMPAAQRLRLVPARTLKRLRLPQARHQELVRKAMRDLGFRARRSWSSGHGVSPSFGARVFEDADYLLIPTFREEDSEDRYKVIGMVDGKFWTAVHVRHGDTVRFI
jgi:uncharacterized DUF497 family protein